VREFWIVNLVAREIEVCRQPQAGRYASIERFGADAEVAPEAFPDIKLRLSDILVA
jgi:Uma2 family endonuclease